MYAIEVSELKKAFGGRFVLNGLTFKVKTGEKVALLGGSGAGKSTLLRCLNLLERPDQGDMSVDGLSFHFEDGHEAIPASALRGLRTHVGMVFQHGHLWPHMTILQNLIEAPRRVLHMSKKTAVEQADYWLNEVEIFYKRDDFPKQLSGGEQQRAAIARALMMQPRVMLFDEPTSALDPPRVTALMLLLERLSKKNMTLMVSTHEMKLAKDLADRTLFLYDGTILEQGETRQMFQAPKTEIFQKFIGEE